MNFDYDPEADAAYLAIVQPGALSERQISGITTEKNGRRNRDRYRRKWKNYWYRFRECLLDSSARLPKKSKPDIIGIIVATSLFLRKSLLKRRLNQTPTARSN